MPKIFYEKLEIAVLQLEPALNRKGLKDIEFYKNDGPCAAGEKTGSKRDNRWDYRLIGFESNLMVVLAEFKRIGIALEFQIKNTPYAPIILESLRQHGI